MKKIFIDTLGCQMNKSDTERILGMLSHFDYEVCEDENIADNELIPVPFIDCKSDFIAEKDLLNNPIRVLVASISSWNVLNTEHFKYSFDIFLY